MFDKLTSARNAGYVFAAAIFLYYGCLPILLAETDAGTPYLYDVSILAVLSSICVLIGFSAPLRTGVIGTNMRKLEVNESLVMGLVWTSLLAFAIVAWVTADEIPLIASFQGADEVTLAYLRERFLKSRGEGWQASLVYINAALTGAVVPYCLARLFVQMSPRRWAALALFLIYCTSFLEKAYFLKVLIPLFYLATQGSTRTRIGPQAIVVAGTILIIALTTLSGIRGDASDSAERDFLSLQYSPTSAVEHIAWRALVVPAYTAGDALRVFEESFGGNLFYGATSSLLSGVMGLERVDFERIVFFSQWGQNETGSGSSNSVFITEAFVNFGYVGVVLFSILVGFILKAISRTEDESLRSLWMLFAMSVFTAGLIGTLASNGFLLVFAFVAFFRFKSDRPEPARRYAVSTAAAG